ncbi:hypothetical protein HMPREF0063_11754 [Aeromicrobium marinum DSM 15272]|uniref:Uncharacterized protein n=1 Tax=Aeromicrobium marinum DSM 15272 TaxID=585531 RepID=E2SDG8_9ACTN|nr:hypothetical protein HMPREF0063_11754 [Aeromicrobium marinum DSM 15272]
MVRVLAAVVTLVALAAIALGLSSPDGEVTSAPRPTEPAPTSAAPTPSAPTPTPSPTPEPVSAALAPRLTVPTAAERCASTTVQATEAVRSAVGDEGVQAAVCQALDFVFDARYSALSLPRQTYTSADFDAARGFLTEAARDRVYASRVAAVVAAPRSDPARRGTGLLLLDGPDAGSGREFFGTDWTTDGYPDRPVWVDPSWSPVRVGLERGGATPRLSVAVETEAGALVWNPASSAVEQMRIDTEGTFGLVRTADGWRIDTWTVSSSRPRFTAAPPA